MALCLGVGTHLAAAEIQIDPIIVDYAPPPRTRLSCRSSGSAAKTFDQGQIVYARGAGLGPGEIVDIHVAPAGAPHDSSNSVSSVQNLVCGPDGTLPVTGLGSLPIGSYDIWIDRDGNGIRDPIEPVTVFTVLVC